MQNLLSKPRVSPSGIAILQKKLALPECKRGIKAIQKCLLRKEKGIVVLASDVTPFDLISHIPGLCLETHTPLFYIDSRFALKTEKDKPTTCLFIPTNLVTSEEISSITA